MNLKQYYYYWKTSFKIKIGFAELATKTNMDFDQMSIDMVIVHDVSTRLNLYSYNN